MISCHYCGETVDSDSRHTLRAVWGWEYKTDTRATGTKGGSDIRHRQPFDRYAHALCVDRERSGVSARQEALV